MKLPLLRALLTESPQVTGRTSVLPNRSQLPPINHFEDKMTLDFAVDALDYYEEKLIKNGIPWGPNKKEIGKPGLKGHAFDLGSTVLKITKDESEANACYRIVGKKLKNVYNVYQVFNLADHYQMYIIHEEKLQPIPTWLALRWDVVMMDPADEYMDGSLNHDQALSKAEGKISALKSRQKELSKYAAQFFNGLKELKDNKILFYDYHSGNIMMRGDEVVIIDLGVSASPPAPIPEIV